jgi:putative alpha-1,2-mannosidase
VDYVNPFIGTDESALPSIWEANGGTYPGAAAPFGMVQFTPENYRYSDKRIQSFSLLNHISGYPNGSSGNFNIMPVNLKVIDKDTDRSSSFDHKSETASPGYYHVFLNDYGIETHFTVTQRAGMCKLMFPESKNSKILIFDVDEINQFDSKFIRGRKGGFYFYAELSKHFEKCASYKNGISIHYSTKNKENILLKIGFSTNSVDGAQKNLETEIPDWNFNLIKNKARECWNSQLERIEVFSNSEEKKEIFYTALYHSLLDPHILSDACEENNYYSELSPWDTFRSKHPLLVLLEPEKQRDMIHSAIKRYEQTGWLPVGPMTGNHNIPVIIDSYVKGITDFDINKAYEAMRKSLFQPPFARRDLSTYLQHQYVPAEGSYSVTKTLEYAYNDWALAQFAKMLDKKDDYKLLTRRSLYYRNLFDPSTKFMRAKSKDGTWSSGGFREGDKWTYTWFVPQNINDLINLFGGAKEFSSKLETCFEDKHYYHDNEPPLHYAYLFNYAGVPWKTQKWAREIVTEHYTRDPGGLAGNDDLGALSSWYVFSAMGFYPTCPGRPIYDIGSPIFKEVTIHLPNGKNFVIKAPGTSDTNKYIQSATLNGKNFNKPWIRHEDITSGGILIFRMGPELNRTWGTGNDVVLPSLTKGKPDFKFTDLQISSHKIEANEPFKISAIVSNVGETIGTAGLKVFVDGKYVKTHWILVDPKKSKKGIISLTLYEGGKHKVTINSLKPKIVNVIAKMATFEYSELKLPSPPIIEIGEVGLFKTIVKNVGSYEGSTKADFYVDGKIIESKIVLLQPGQEKEVSFAKEFSKPGLHRISVGDLSPQKIYAFGAQSETKFRHAIYKKFDPLLIYNFEDGPGKVIKDKSSHGTDGIVKGKVEWINGIFGKAIQTNALDGSYIEIPSSPVLNKIENSYTITVMLWIYPMDEKNFADIITQGDWNVIQMKASNTVVNFYSGGYERGEVYANVPANWNRNWHHIAGITDGQKQKLFIDGKLVATKEIEILNNEDKIAPIGNTNFPWNIGRNAQNPKRVFNGYIDEVRIYQQALSEKEIQQLMLNVIE